MAVRRQRRRGSSSTHMNDRSNISPASGAAERDEDILSNSRRTRAACRTSGLADPIATETQTAGAMVPVARRALPAPPRRRRRSYRLTGRRGPRSLGALRSAVSGGLRPDSRSSRRVGGVRMGARRRTGTRLTARSVRGTVPRGPVAQWQSRGLLILWSWVRIPPGSPPVCSIRNAACHSRRASDTLTPLASPHAFPPWQATAPQQAADRLPAPPSRPGLHRDARRGLLRDRAPAGDALPLPSAPARPDLTHEGV